MLCVCACRYTLCVVCTQGVRFPTSVIVAPAQNNKTSSHAPHGMISAIILRLLFQGPSGATSTTSDVHDEAPHGSSHQHAQHAQHHDCTNDNFCEKCVDTTLHDARRTYSHLLEEGHGKPRVQSMWNGKAHQHHQEDRHGTPRLPTPSPLLTLVNTAEHPQCGADEQWIHWKEKSQVGQHTAFPTPASIPEHRRKHDPAELPEGGNDTMQENCSNVPPMRGAGPGRQQRHLQRRCAVRVLGFGSVICRMVNS